MVDEEGEAGEEDGGECREDVLGVHGGWTVFCCNGMGCNVILGLERHRMAFSQVVEWL